MSQLHEILSPLDPRVTGHLPALDGLRGLAILGVMFLHMTVLKPVTAVDRVFFFLFDLGGVGVDLFFVLSGFLITGILLDEPRGDGFFRAFYARRVLRIFPLYFALLAITYFLLPLVPIPVVQKIVSTDVSVWPYLTFTSNFAIAASGRFRNPVLDISWSLSIEEQFYLAWPLLVYLCKPRTIVRWCVAIVLLAAVSRSIAAFAGMNAQLVYMPTWHRLDGLALGALAATVARNAGGVDRLHRVLRIVGPVAALVTLTLLATLRTWTPTDAGYGLRHGPTQTLLSLAFVALLVGAVARPASALAHSLAWRPLRVLGKYSYALYLIHLPLRGAIRDVVLPRIHVPTIGDSTLPRQLIFFALAMPASVAVAWLSWHAFEKHFLKLKVHFERSRRDVESDEIVQRSN